MKYAKYFFYGCLFLIGISLLVNMFSGPSQPEKSDTELFNAFYSDIMTKTSIVDATYRPFGDALSKGDVFTATKESLKIKHIINSQWNDIYTMNVPKLKNTDAYKSLTEGKDSISQAYMYKTEMVANFIKFSESRDMKSLAELSNNAEQILPLGIAGLAKIYEAGEKIGIKASDVAKK